MAAVISPCLASILACGVLVLVVRRARSPARVGLCVPVTGVTLTPCAWIMLRIRLRAFTASPRTLSSADVREAVRGASWPRCRGAGGVRPRP
ncbi:hypothetical protein [Streptomyces luteogriseus]|uniref:hypothetical protein n=1 Tax=Streptomyces luteogriseus TaxID=68233 RepID=UPI0038200C59